MQTRSRRSAIVAACIVALVALVGVWALHRTSVRTYLVRLPDGSSARVEYLGVAPDSAALARLTPEPVDPWPSGEGLTSPDPLADALRRQAETMLNLQRALAMAQAAEGVTPAAVADGRSAASAGFCGRSTQITAGADGRLHIVTHTWGHCGDAIASPAPPAPRPPAAVVGRQV